MGRIILKISMIIPFILFASCASIKTKPILINLNHYMDENYPSVKIDFPFPIFLLRSEKDYHCNSENSAVCVNDSRNILKVKNQDKYIIVSKQSLGFDGHFSYFTRTDDSKINENYFLLKNIYGYCSVYPQDKNGTYLLRGDVVKYSGNKNVLAIFVQYKLGYPEAFDTFEVLKNRENTKKFIIELKNICDQVVPRN